MNMKTTDKPEPTCKGLVFYPIPEFSGIASAFGAEESRYFKRRDLPDVPMEFERMAQSLFFSGGKLPDMPSCIDRTKAMAAVKAWLRSFEPAHEAKIATVAYALWVWITREE